MGAATFHTARFAPAPVAELFNTEDKAFIARSVEWLRDRPSKDMILSRIWEELQETEPESFLAPPEALAEPEESDPEEIDRALLSPPPDSEDG